MIGLLLENGIVSVRNWLDEKGSPVSIEQTKQGTANLAFLDRLSVPHRVELANAIDARRKVSVRDSD